MAQLTTITDQVVALTLLLLTLVEARVVRRSEVEMLLGRRNERCKGDKS